MKPSVSLAEMGVFEKESSLCPEMVLSFDPTRESFALGKTRAFVVPRPQRLGQKVFGQTAGKVGSLVFCERSLSCSDHAGSYPS